MEKSGAPYGFHVNTMLILYTLYTRSIMKKAYMDITHIYRIYCICGTGGYRRASSFVDVVRSGLSQVTCEYTHGLCRLHRIVSLLQIRTHSARTRS